MAYSVVFTPEARAQLIALSYELSRPRGHCIAVEGSEVWIIGVFYAGQDYEAILQI